MASKYIITGCTVADSDELTKNNIPAFWADPHWNLAWRHRTLEYHISQVAKRTPRNLISDPETKRQQKAVDPANGRIVGFARWILPASHAKDDNGAPAWLDAVVPSVSVEEEAEIRRVAATADWDPNDESDELLIPIREAKNEILAKKDYMRALKIFLKLSSLAYQFLIGLDYLAVHPDNQGKGIGTALVQSGMARAKEMGLDIFIHAMEAGVDLYKRLGFCIEKEFFQDDTTYGGNGQVYTALMIFKQD
ncbi:acetyltransferase [Colletotrichum orchidophilum]|uniref:Acetyltransferase n=1 Tax=Colletotrichum orchidophilum TaxID=1209926 RepID=A0A1G4BNT3_9PEZI|nr:acetyltransferase [Colletotrichum orchidophilum]OHF02975.1 acetyltransferase [Colletotrichum orchidophilum]